MKKIKLYDYQQKMLEDIINVLTSDATSTFYKENGKKERVGSSVMVQMPTTVLTLSLSRWPVLRCR